MVGRAGVSCTEEAAFREGYDRRDERLDSGHLEVLLSFCTGQGHLGFCAQMVLRVSVFLDREICSRGWLT